MDRGAWRAAGHGVTKESDVTQQPDSNSSVSFQAQFPFCYMCSCVGRRLGLLPSRWTVPYIILRNALYRVASSRWSLLCLILIYPSRWFWPVFVWCIFFNLLKFKLIEFIFWDNFWFTEKLSRKYTEFPYVILLQ